MPFLLKPPVCKNCKVSMAVVEARLTCDSCNKKAKPLSAAELDRLEEDWPLCHSEFMSLERYAKCANGTCPEELKEFFPHGRVPLDHLPGTYDTRVFVGGNYDNMPDLRHVKAAVQKLQAGFVPILPYDDFQIPPDRIYEWDLRLLHNCKYAIFEVTNPAGELFEIARVGEYGTTTLLVYATRGAVSEPSRARSMLLQSGAHEHRSYMDHSHLEQIVDGFLRHRGSTQWKQAVAFMGYHFAECRVEHKLYLNGGAEHRVTYKGLKVDIPDLKQSQLTHEFAMTSGSIVADSFRLRPTKSVSWHRDSAKSGVRAEAGVVQFDPALDRESAPLDYGFRLRTKNAYLLAKEQLAKLPREDITDPFLGAGLEFASRTVSFPIEELTLSVEFPCGYQVEPEAAVYFGVEPRSDALKPPDDFSFDGKTARLYVHRPRVHFMYSIYWPLPEKLPSKFRRA